MVLYHVAYARHECNTKSHHSTKGKGQYWSIAKTFTINTLGVKLSAGVTVALHSAKCYIFLTYVKKYFCHLEKSKVELKFSWRRWNQYNNLKFCVFYRNWKMPRMSNTGITYDSCKSGSDQYFLPKHGKILGKLWLLICHSHKLRLNSNF